MEKFQETIEATSVEDAHIKAGKLFGVDESNILVNQVGEGLFFAAVKNLDAEIRLSISDDKMSVQIQHVHGHLGDGRPLSGQLIREALTVKGVTVAVANETVDAIIQQVAAGASLQDDTVVRGTPPVHGQNGTVELKVQTGIYAGEEDEHNRVDYHERGFVETVQQGDELGRFVFSTQGRPGTDVFGNQVPAQAGKGPVFEVGEFVTVDDNGIIRAQKSGMVQYAHGVLSITELFEHSGDVDFHTGNIHMDEGSLLVKGTVRSGFEVSALGNVIVGKTVREVTIESGGDIELKQGAIESHLRAKGNVYTQFAQNTAIDADGNVVVANNLHNCMVTAGDSVIVKTGKGIVRGGTIRCAQMFEAKEVGSENEVDTLIELGQRTDEEKALHKERADIIDAISHKSRILGCDDCHPDLSGKTEAEQQEILKELEELRQLQKRRTEISSLLASKNKERIENVKFRVIVANTVFPGTRIIILGRSFLVKTPLSRCMFMYSPERDKVIVEAI
ncbi:MAG: DUF342 domain-containing protein [Deltaproteobacteria bacterium]|nr:DUF342 domain-containing protein [Deltaproteobacteria bacterium]